MDATSRPDGSAIVDESPIGRTLTAAGSASIQNQFFEFDGTDDWINAADSAEWRFYDGSVNLDFTIELFGVVFDAPGSAADGGGQALISQYDAFSPAANQRALSVNLSNVNLGISISTTGSSAVGVISFAWTPTLGRRYDIAVCRKGTTWRLFIDGVVVGTATQSGVIFNSTSPLSIGGRNTRGTSGQSDDLDGRIKAVRITQAARFDSNYAVPLLPLPRG